MDKKELVFATNNANKASEIQAILGDSFRIKTLSDIQFYDDIEETETTLEGNAVLKSKHIYDRFQCNVFSDDTGLEITALKGEPGVYSARYAGDDKNNDANMDLVLAKLRSFDNKKARFKTVISLFWDNTPHVFEGVVTGHIISVKRGDHGFGYDPIFVPDGFDKTFAEMSSAEKNSVSHRGRAIAKMVAFLTRQ